MAPIMGSRVHHLRDIVPKPTSWCEESREERQGPRSDRHIGLRLQVEGLYQGTASAVPIAANSAAN
ncbi:MAG TPA: hypothetical protein VJO35_04570 [Terriglobales bacterium]|nr:hypothetical protein [Terriglobales bacterium]